MALEKGQQEKQPPSSTTNPAAASCRKKKSDDATFLEDVRDHIDEFINASLDEHKTCFKKTIQKMFGMSRIVAQRNSATEEVESSLPLQAGLSVFGMSRIVAQRNSATEEVESSLPLQAVVPDK